MPAPPVKPKPPSKVDLLVGVLFAILGVLEAVITILDYPEHQYRWILAVVFLAVGIGAVRRWRRAVRQVNEGGSRA